MSEEQLFEPTEEQWMRDEENFAQDMLREREANEQWQKEEDERKARRSKMTKRERILDKQKQQEEEEDEWEKLVQQSLVQEYLSPPLGKVEPKDGAKK